MVKISKDIPHYLSLLLILALGLLAFLIFSSELAYQIAILILTSIAYVVWGLLHHYLHKDLYLGVVIEYIVVATLGLVIVFSLVFN